MRKKRILYVDMDGVIADFIGKIHELHPEICIDDADEYQREIDDLCFKNPLIFDDLKPIVEGIEAVKILMEIYDVYFLSTPMWEIPESYTSKRRWLFKYFEEDCKKKLILTHRKDLQRGAFLIDDRLTNGSEDFQGFHIHYGQFPFEDWNKVFKFLVKNDLEFQKSNIIFPENLDSN